MNNTLPQFIYSIFALSCPHLVDQFIEFWCVEITEIFLIITIITHSDLKIHLFFKWSVAYIFSVNDRGMLKGDFLVPSNQSFLKKINIVQSWYSSPYQLTWTILVPGPWWLPMTFRWRGLFLKSSKSLRESAYEIEFRFHSLTNCIYKHEVLESKLTLKFFS